MADVQKTENIYKILNPNNSAEKLMDLYDGWATQYENDVHNDNFNAPEIAFRAFQSVVANKEANILDIAAGTGLLGLLLKEDRYTNVDAIDANEAMLDIARKRNCYKNIIVDFLAKNKLNVENDTYDAVVGSGVFAPGHVNEDSFDELCRITKPGGYVIIVSCERYYEEQYDGYAQKLQNAIQEYESRGLWKREKKEIVDSYQKTYGASVSYLIVQ